MIQCLFRVENAYRCRILDIAKEIRFWNKYVENGESFRRSGRCSAFLRLFFLGSVFLRFRKFLYSFELGCHSGVRRDSPLGYEGLPEAENRLGRIYWYSMVFSLILQSNSVSKENPSGIDRLSFGHSLDISLDI